MKISIVFYRLCRNHGVETELVSSNPYLPPLKQAVSQYLTNVGAKYQNGLPQLSVGKEAFVMPRRMDERVMLKVRRRATFLFLPFSSHSVTHSFPIHSHPILLQRARATLPYPTLPYPTLLVP